MTLRREPSQSAGSTRARLRAASAGLTRRLLAAALAALPAALLAAGPALAHVTVNPREATKGGFAELTFRVPNERESAGTTKVEVFFPIEEHPFASVSVRPTPGWDYEVTRQKLDQPVEAHGEQITAAVAKITWTGGIIRPGEYQSFSVSAGPLPEDADQLVFKAIQTYENGEVVRWIEEAVEGQPEPEHPAPVLKLVAAPAAEGASPAPAGGPTAAALPAAATTDGDVAAARNLAVAGLVVGAAGLAVGALGLIAARRRPAPAPAPDGARQATPTRG